MDANAILSDLMTYLRNTPEDVKTPAIVAYLATLRNLTVAEFLKTGTHGQLTFYFTDNRQIRTELITSDVPTAEKKKCS
jgi:hypothetical protein